MKISYELDLNTFKAWSGAVDTLERIRNEGKISECEQLLEEYYSEGLDESELNDILRFDDEWLFKSLGIRTYDEIKEELDDKKEELEEMENNLKEEIEDAQEDEDCTPEDIKDIYEMYEDDINDLKEEIKELEEELENA